MKLTLHPAAGAFVFAPCSGTAIAESSGPGKS
jgi:hypothetical protein